MKKIIDQLWKGQLSLSHSLQSARAEFPTLASSQTSCYFVTVTGKYLASSNILDRIQLGSDVIHRPTEPSGKKQTMGFLWKAERW